eukprot:252481-Pleurochrysis_carterae.AAC.5
MPEGASRHSLLPSRLSSSDAIADHSPHVSAERSSLHGLGMGRTEGLGRGGEAGGEDGQFEKSGK